MYTLEPAKIEEVKIYDNIIHDGRMFQRQQGFTQWTDEYPNEDAIRGDIELGRGYVFYVDGQPAAYMCIDFNGESAYDSIDGEWLTNEPYAVIHRIAISSQFRGQGLTGEIFNLAADICSQKRINSIRIDTYCMNERMQHVLKKCGFSYCGIVMYPFGERLAYERVV